MRTYRIAGGLLLCTAFALGQGNVVPDSAINGAVKRALTLPIRGVPGAKPLTFHLSAPSAKTCAIPLLNARVKQTNDRIAPRHILRDIDPKFSHAPPVPACPRATP